MLQRSGDSDFDEGSTHAKFEPVYFEGYHECPAGPGAEIFKNDGPFKKWIYDDIQGGEDAEWTADVQRLAAEYRAQGPFFGIVGFSQGAKAAMYLLRHLEKEKNKLPAVLPDFVMLVCGTSPFHYIHDKRDPTDPKTIGYDESLAKGIVKVPSYHVIGNDDPFRPESEALQDFFDPSMRTLVRFKGGHQMPPGTQKEPGLNGLLFRYIESHGFRLCNDRSKGCWLSRYGATDWDIHTDYENRVPHGVVREYTLTVAPQPSLSPDGQPKTNGVTFNNTYPGPAIEACWGDYIVVHVKNQYKDNGTTVHWHGIRQYGSNEMDGVNGVTQCPIPYGEEYTYAFRATQYGHSWYHSHYSLQYPDGVAGPLIIHGPTSDEWDIDVGPILVADWTHETAFEVFNCEAYQCGGQETPPKSDGIVVNGVGPFKQGNGQFTVNYFNATFKPGKKHLLRLINGSAASSYVFSIDNHTMTVVAADFVAIKPYKTDSLLLGIGQRYTIIVEANQQKSTYWMRTTPAAGGCSSFRTDANGNFLQVKETMAMVIYEGAPHVQIPGPDSVKQPNITSACVDQTVDQDRLVPIVPWKVAGHPSNNVTRDSFTAALGATDIPDLVPDHPYAHWVLANDSQSKPVWVDFNHPTILDPTSSPKYSSIVRFNQSSGFIYLIIDSQYLFNPNPEFLYIPAAHPIHLHGSDFVILGQNASTYDPIESPKHFKFDNPSRRDTALLPAGGYLAIAFKPDNPGAWLMHCHIAWHASSGLALQLVVRPREIRDINGDLAPVQQVCNLWNSWVAQNPVTQTDSGV
ncbi:multicopper oxidase-domain-containing protein [Bombardia bombarda]|uniref:Multicopper oxidase-domain-containing protein n=1 Tax=Bombardia bombarda TaxID=252184 RepID=A0AA39XCJ4_9PEZI|nr:multicopper oxidase-domain-containing protein [Bombardia bombarda]